MYLEQMIQTGKMGIVKVAMSVIVMTFLISGYSYSQYTTTIDTLNCQGGTTTFVVDLSANPDSTWISPPQLRAGDCCGTDNNCVQFALTLSPQASGINFFVPDGCGATPSGSLFYQVDCGPLTNVGEPICLSGSGPFILTFCKPGNNENCYSIQSIPMPATGGDVITADGCQDTLSVTGLVVDSISWNSISPGFYGDYNGLLSDTASTSFGTNGVPFENFDVVVVTPGFGSPSTIQYEVCGTVVGECLTETWCDTVTVDIYPTLFAAIQPQEPAVCNGGTATTLTATPTGGTAPYYFQWSTTADPALDGATTQSIDVTLPGEYIVMIWDTTGCPADYDTVVVVDYSSNITVNAGADINVCVSPDPTVTLNGSSPETGAVHWENYSGTFNTNDADTIAQYTPSAAEVTAGYAELILISDNNYTCPGDTDTVVINIIQFEAVLSLDSTNVTCTGAGDGMIDLTVSGGYGPHSFAWSNAEVTEDITNLVPGNYAVIVTNSYGCVDSIEISITEPTPLGASSTAFVYPSGDNISCNGMNDGSIDLAVNGGSPTYTYNWSTLDGSGLVAGNEDQSGLTAGTYDVTITDVNGCSVTNTITLTEPTPLAASSTAFVYPSGDNISCNGMNDGSIDLTVNGGSPVYTYNWSTLDGSGLNVSSEDQSNLTAGTYDVTITDVNGCSVTNTITLTEPTPLAASSTAFVYPSGDNISCNGMNDGSIDLTVNGGSPVYTYNWSTLDGSGLNVSSEDQSGLTAGTYDVTITDINGCSVTNTVTLTEPTPLGASSTAFVYPSGDNISCNGMNDGSIDLTVNGGSPVYTYNWSTLNGSGLVAGNEDQSGLTAGTYDVTITDVNGCSVTNTITLTEPTPLAASSTAFVYPSGDNISCNGMNDGSIDLTVNGGSPVYTYNWSTLDGNGLNASVEDQSNLTAGTYDVTITDVNGCSVTNTITLTEPTTLGASSTAFVYPSGDNISCNGMNDGSIDLTVNGGSPTYTFNWSTLDGSGLNVSSEDQSNLTAGTYDVTITDVNGCSVTNTITLTEPTTLGASSTAFVYPSGDNISCNEMNDGSIDLTVNGGSPTYTFNWSTLDGSGLVAGNEDQSNLTAGIYDVTITDINGCSVTNTITLTEPTLLGASSTAFVYPSGDNISCNGINDGSIDLTVNGGSPIYTFNWSTLDGSGLNVSSEDQSGLTAGTYDVTITDVNGCSVTNTIILIEPTPLGASSTAFVYPSGDNISCNGMNDGSIDLTVNGGSPTYTFNWSTLDGSGLNVSSEDQSNLTAGTYDVTITDVNGCSVTNTITLTEPTPLGASSTAFVYPSGDNISCNGMNDGSIDLAVNGGSPAYAYNWSTLDGSGLVAGNEDQSNLTAGTYDVTITDVNGCSVTNTITLTEPTPLGASSTAFVYPSGDNISCNGMNDGSIDLAVNGGSPSYTYNWSTLDGSGLNVSSEDQSNLTAGTYDVTITDVNGCSVTNTITLIEPTPLGASSTAFVYPSGDNISCNGMNDGSIDLTVNGGSPVYTYNWSTLDGSGLTAGNEDQSGLTAGTYDVTITDVNGCSVTNTITLTEPTLLGASSTVFVYPSGDNISCNGMNDGSIDLTVNGGSPAYIFNWSTLNGSGLVAGNEDQSGLTAGTYDVTITDVNGCSVTNTITLTEPTPLGASSTAFVYPSGDNISCNGMNDGSIDLTVNGGSPAYTYNWSTLDGSGLTAGNEDQSNLTAGTYDVTITDVNGCSVTNTITLTEPTPLAASSTAFVYPSGDNISCNGMNDGSIDLTVNGGSPVYTYTWSTLDGSGLNVSSEDQSNLTAGTYDVTITDVNGCSVTNTITLTEPTPLGASSTAFVYPSGDNISCNGMNDGSIDLTVNGGSPVYTFNWSTLDGSGLVAGNEDQSNLTAGTYDVTITDVNGCSVTNTITLTEPTLLGASSTAFVYPSGDNISCNGMNDGSIDLTVNGGSPTYTFNWSTFDGSGLVAGNEDQSNLTAGTYDVTITDVNGCSVTNTITLTEPAPLGASSIAFVYPSGDNISCNGMNDGSIDLTVNGGSPTYTFNWSTLDGSGLVAGNEDQTGLTAGTYDVTITDVNGCSVVNSITLTEPTPLGASSTAFVYPSGDNISCNGMNDGSIDLTVNGGSPVYTYTWSTLDGSGLNVSSEDQSNLTAGTYDVTITDVNGCSVANTITLTEPTPLGASSTAFVYPSGDNISCNGMNDGSIDLSVNGGSPTYTFNWSTLDGSGLNVSSEDQSGLTAGTYDVTVTDINGCSVTNSVTLAEPDQIAVISSYTNVSCYGMEDGTIDVTVDGGSPAYVFAWTTPNGSGLLPGIEDQTGLGAGTYDLTVTDMNGCSIVKSYVITEPDALAANITILSDFAGVAVSCDYSTDGEIEASALGGTPGYTYSWNTSPVQSGAILSGVPVGAYDVTVTDINGCTTTASVVLEGNPAPIYQPDPAIEVCQGEVVTFSANTGNSDMCYWELSNGMAFDMCGQNTAYIDEPGCYDALLVVTSQYGCSDTLFMDDYICIRENPIADFSADTSGLNILHSEVDFTNHSYNANSYEWEFGDGGYSTEIDPTHTYPGDNPGDYEVILTAHNEYGCMDTASMIITVHDELLFYVPNTFTPDDGNFNETFFPVFGSGYSPEGYSLRIFNRWGEQIFETSDVNQGWDGTFKGTEAQQGTYSWKITLYTSDDTYFGSWSKDYIGHVNLLR